MDTELTLTEQFIHLTVLILDNTPRKMHKMKTVKVSNTVTLHLVPNKTLRSQLAAERKFNTRFFSTCQLQLTTGLRRSWRPLTWPHSRARPRV